MGDALRVEDHGAVRHLVLCRPDELNTITLGLRDELDAELDAADADNSVRVVLVRAEGRAFCAGFGLDWSTVAQSEHEGTESTSRVWDTVADVQMIGLFGNTFAKLHSISKPTLAAVQGWCIAGGTDMILNADLIVAGESARFGYPPARVWGVPEAPWVWVARLGLERAKRYLFTGDEIPAPAAAEMGMILECVPDDELGDHTATSPTPADCWASSSTASPATPRKGSTSLTAPRMSAGVMRCASVTSPSVTTGSATGRDAAPRRVLQPASRIAITNAVSRSTIPCEVKSSRPSRNHQSTVV